MRANWVSEVKREVMMLLSNMMMYGSQESGKRAN